MAALSKAELAAIAQEATIDAHDEDEQAMGLHEVIVDTLMVPFLTSVLGVDVTVESVDNGKGNGILAIWARGGIRQAIGVVGLPLPEPPPAGAEWIDTYRYWLGWPHGKGQERSSADGAGLG